MINTDDLYIVNYCHPNCKPLKNIFRLPIEEAFLLAYEMAQNNQNTTAFYRFADFENYYPLRIKQDKLLYKKFISLGGKPIEKHPLSFVLQGSEYLKKWFDNGLISKILLKDVPAQFISFTLGDSGALLANEKVITMYTKDMLLNILKENNGTIDEFMREIEKEYSYIEVQLWDDEYCMCKKK